MVTFFVLQVPDYESAMLIYYYINSDSQNYVYSHKFFLSRPLLQWKKGGGEIWKNLFELNKQVNIRKSILLNVK